MALAGEEAAGSRLDVFLAAHHLVPSRSAAQRLIEGGRVLVDGAAVRKPSYRLRPGERVEVRLPPPAPVEVVPEEIPLDILYEDEDLVVVNKPRGMPVHPGAGRSSGTLVNALLAHCRDLSGVGGALRPGIVHRLDKDTTGLLVVAKHDAAHLHLARQIKERRVTRIYLALVHGRLPAAEGKIEAPIGRHPVARKKMAVVARRGRAALTYYRVLEEWARFSLLEVKLGTGRTHQIRVHLAYLGHPVAGDPTYGRRRAELGLEGQALHAAVLGFCHPRTGEYVEFSAPPPEDFQRALALLRSGAV
ncbi:MAG: RluA family pseudouridine synthase [Bacillota bacterium]|nr:RluA family pseudouridine synthase [Bacillota bacterium]